MQTKHLFTYSAILLTSLLFSRCKAIIEPDISKRIITAEAPGKGYQTSNYTVNFWWDEVEDALSYRLQVVVPKFDSVAKLVLDTIVKTTQFTVNLSPGQYEWHVRAQNGSYQTAYSGPHGFTIFQSSIKPQSIQLKGPVAGTMINQQNVLFSWSNLFGATQYRLEIDTNNFINESNLFYNQATPSLTAQLTLSRDKLYQWRVRAENDTAQSQWSPIRSFTFDRTPPDQVSLVAPSQGQTLPLPVNLQWSNPAGAVKYKLYVLKSDSTTLVSNFPLTVTSTTYNFNQGTSRDKYYWKVSAIDAAGNEGTVSMLRNFTLQ